MKWHRIFIEATASTPDTPGEEFSAQRSEAVTYAKGRTYTERWNKAPFAPTLSDPSDDLEYITRYQDTLYADPTLFGDAAGHTGYGYNSTEHLTITRDGTTIADTTNPAVAVDVPPGRARYTVTADTTRGAPSQLSTKVTAVWTFDSAHVDGTTVQRLPVSVVRFAPDLAATNTAKAGTTLAIPVTVQHQPGSANIPTASLKVQVSYDDGKTWTPADVTTTKGATTATVTNPKQPGFVSLRGAVTDTSGNACDVTIIRAYRIIT